MMRISSRRASALTFGAFIVTLSLSREAPRAQDLGSSVSLRPGQEVTFSVAVADGRVTPGQARPSRPGAAKPRDGEITVSVVKQDRSPYAEISASEKTSAPIDFVATGLVGGIKIDEIRVCGRLDGPLSAHIYSGSWRISLNRFSVGPEQACR